MLLNVHLTYELYLWLSYVPLRDKSLLTTSLTNNEMHLLIFIILQVDFKLVFGEGSALLSFVLILISFCVFTSYKYFSSYIFLVLMATFLGFTWYSLIASSEMKERYTATYQKSYIHLKLQQYYQGIMLI